MLENKRKYILTLIFSVIYIIYTYCFAQNLKAGLVFAFVLWIIGLIPYEKIAVNGKYRSMINNMQMPFDLSIKSNRFIATSERVESSLLHELSNG